jgi:eukaryotic-like serine/threonine-protein kinase
VTKRILIIRSGKGVSTRARAYAMARWPAAKLRLHDLESQGMPAAEFPWTKFDLILIDDRYARREGLLWISELRSKKGFPRVERVPADTPIPKELRQRAAAAATHEPVAPNAPPPVTEAAESSHGASAREEARRLKDAEELLAATGITEFKPITTIGQGATATVCLCERISNHEQVVLKILRAEGSTDHDMLPRFVQEYLTAAKIDSPNIARVYEHAFTESHAYIVMEYFPEGDLKARITRQKPTPEESITIVASVLNALITVHAAGVIHRDLKPGNIMFRADGTMALTDFGCAQHDEDPVLETLAGVVIGTPYYLSPEQANGEVADPRADLYSVGVIFYELLAGQRMYKARTVADLLEMHKSAPTPELPAPLKKYQPFLDKLCAKRPHDRFQTAAAALDALMALAINDDQTQVA